MIGRLVRVPLREVWTHEARGFTTWLENNVDVLNEVLNLRLSAVEREGAAGTFAVDLIAEDENGNAVVIENQLDRSDHDHLGKLITYLTSLEARAAIWIVADPRPEHVRAITWLNEASPAAFYMLKAEAVRIDESPPAILLTLIVGPSEEGREVGDTKKDLAERHILRIRFWEQLLHRARGRTTLHSGISPSKETWIGTGAGKSGLALNYVCRQHDAQVGLYIDRGKERGEENKAIFERLLAAREAIEERYGGALEWERREGRRVCVISQRIPGGGYRDEDKWPEVHEAMIGAMIRLEKALRPEIDRLDI